MSIFYFSFSDIYCCFVPKSIVAFALNQHKPINQATDVHENHQI